MAIPKSIQFLYISAINFSLLLTHSSSVSFNFSLSDPTVYEQIKYEGGVTFSKGGMSLNIDTKVPSLANETGRATYNQPVPLWDENTGEVTNFTTRFSFLIQNTTPYAFGDGFAFFLSQYPSQIPPQSAGGYLGLFNPSTALNVSANQLVAVEFDTYLNYDLDPNSPDTTACHIGIDVNTVNSISYQLIPNTLFVGMRMTAKVEYNSLLKLLTVSLWHEDNPKIQFSLNATVDIKNHLPNVAAVGFSAAIRNCVEVHQIFSWSFNSTLELKQNSSILPPSESPSLIKHKIVMSAPVIGGIVACAFLMFSLVVILIYYLRKCYIEHIGEIEMFGINESICMGDLVQYDMGGPKMFPYSELVDATKGFGVNEKLGEGGFGSVYRGILEYGNIHVAVKRVSRKSKQGQKEYISEVNIIGQLWHRNLVQLIGWCHDHGELLLVYELLNNGSLDMHLYNEDSLLSWPMRQKIALGLCSALEYLHSRCIIHRNIKPSNIMLDSLFNAKLGDFGLAGLNDHNQAVETTVPGSWGYLAPECTFGTANASTQSDIFSFGVVLLEIVCGRRPIMSQQDNRKLHLVEWVWDLYGRNALLDAIDTRLSGAYNADEVKCMMIVGLWCAHPDKSMRPSIRQAMSVLLFQFDLPVLPQDMPLPLYVTSMDPNMEPCSSSEASSNC